MDATIIHIWMLLLSIYGCYYYPYMDATIIHIWMLLLSIYGRYYYPYMDTTIIHIWMLLLNYRIIKICEIKQVALMFTYECTRPIRNIKFTLYGENYDPMSN